MSSTDLVWAEHGRWSTFQEPSGVGVHKWIFLLQSPVARRPGTVEDQPRAKPSVWNNMTYKII